MIVFGDSIIREIKLKDFDQKLKNGYATFKSFPSCNSKGMLRYTELTSETGFYDAILHVGVNDLLNDKSSSSTDNLVSNLVNIVKNVNRLE